jgi:RNA polymerase sigma-70 factor (ECF subfamily)
MPDFSELYKEHFTVVYKTCLALFRDADFAAEVTQEAFVRAYINLDKLRDERKFKTWVIAIAKRYGYYKLRLDRSRYASLPPDDFLGQDSDQLISDERRVEIINDMRSWILTLSDDDQQLVLLKYFHHMTNADVGADAGKKPDAVKRRLALLRSKYRESQSAKKRDAS